MKFRIWSFLLAVILIQACATPEEIPEPVAPVEPVYTAQAGLTDKERFRKVLSLLEQGEPEPARAELIAYLESQPKSTIGADLLQQIDLPANEYFPVDYTEVELPSGVSLSGLAKHYLGSVFKFHALAKYNDLARPGDLTAGQMIKIPLTPEAKEAIAGGWESLQESSPASEQEIAVQEPLEQPEGEPQEQGVGANSAANAEPVEAEPEPEVTQEEIATQVSALHRDALNAYRAQNLDKAIALWDEVLVLDPGFESARLYRSQAIELKQKLKNFD